MLLVVGIDAHTSLVLFDTQDGDEAQAQNYAKETPLVNSPPLNFRKAYCINFETKVPKVSKISNVTSTSSTSKSKFKQGKVKKVERKQKKSLPHVEQFIQTYFKDVKFKKAPTSRVIMKHLFGF